MPKSLITLLSLVFGIIFVLINSAFILYYFSLHQEFLNHLDHRMKFGMKLVYDQPLYLEQKLSALGLQQYHVNPQPLQQGKVLGGDPFYRIYENDGELYGIGNYPQAIDPLFHHPPFPRNSNDRPNNHNQRTLGEKNDFPPLIVHNNIQPVILHNTTQEPFVFFFGIWIITLVLLVALFVIIIRKLLPLKRLKEAIVLLRNGDASISIQKESEDEIGEVTHEFQKTVDTLTHVKEARTLFLRNVLHELNTPIMKGKLLSDMVEGPDIQGGLKRVFQRLEVVLGELVMIERFSSQTVALSLQKYRLVDLLDHAQDLLLRDKLSLEIISTSDDQWIDADFDLFATALKNLLDNALRYTHEGVGVIITPTTLSITNKSDPLPFASQQFDKPFNRSFESSSNGLGLGLYIASEIITRHGFEMTYSYHDGNVIFTIKF